MTTTATYNAFFHAVRLEAREWGQSATTAATAIWSSVYAYARPDYYEAHPLALPLVHPEVWECHSRHTTWRDGCPSCSWAKGIWSSLFGDEWREGESSPQPEDTRWRSAEQALLTYATADGRLSVRSGSTLGRMQDAAAMAEKLARSRGRKLSADELQALVRAEVGAGASGHRDLTSRSDDFVEVERALRRALPPNRCEGLTHEQAVAVLLARIVGTYQREKTSGLGRPWTRPVKATVAEIAERFEVSPEAVRRLTRRGMQAVRVELAARSLTPMPKMGTRAHHEAHKRREELGNG